MVAPPGNDHETHGAPGKRRGLAGDGLLAVWARVRPEDEDELNRWYAAEHLPERLEVPGFLGVRRYLDPAARTYLALYELDSPEVLASPDYHRRATEPTDWTRRVLGSFRWSRRRAYRLDASRGAGLGGSAGALVFAAGDGGITLPDRPLLDQALAGDPALVAAHLFTAAEDRLLLVEGAPEAVRARVAALGECLGLTPGPEQFAGDLLVSL
jgi:hypothetical protein